MTAESFLAWSESWAEGERYELVAGEAVAMSPERNRHNLVKIDSALALREAVSQANIKCTVLGDGVTIVVDDNTVYEPDVTVQCGEAVDLDSITVPEPCILVEVLSPSTKGVDTGGKLAGYFQLPSVQHYLVVDPDKHVVIHHYRMQDKIGTEIFREGVMYFEPPGLSISVSDLFQSVR